MVSSAPHARRVSSVHLRPRRLAQVVAGICGRGFVPLNSYHRAIRSDGLSQHSGEQAGTAEQVKRGLAGPRGKRRHDFFCQNVGCSGMDLPEARGADPPVPSGGAISQEPGRAGCARIRLPVTLFVARVPADQQRAIRSLRRRDDLDPAGSRPGAARDPYFGDKRMSDQAVADRGDVMRPMPVEAGPAVTSDSESDPGPPAKTCRVTRQRRDAHRSVHPRDALELLPDDLRLDLALCRQAGMLPVTATAAARTRVRARRAYPSRDRPYDLGRLATRELRSRLRDDGFDQLTGKRMPHENDRLPTMVARLSAAWPCDAPAAMDRLPYVQLQDVADLEGLRVLIPHATIVPSGCRIDFTG